MEKALANFNKENLMTNANFVGLLALTGFTIKNNIELSKKLKHIEEEMENIKGSFNENNKRANIVFTRLNQRIQETNNNIKVYEKDEKIKEIPESNFENKDDVSAALEVLMNRK
tara:strand:+ start:1495 stop:1836 length:342 start_codon:yes stop_codon:yes gene_type:complete